MADFITPEEFDAQLRRQRILQTPRPELPPMQQQDLSFAYPGISPAQPTARMEYESFRQTEPKKEAYPPSRLRKALAIAGGIAGGIGTRSVAGGIGIGDLIKYGPYYKKEQEFQQELKKRADVMKSEEEGRKLGATLGETEAKTRAEGARAGQEEATAGLRKGQLARLTPGTPQAEEAERIVNLQQQGKGPLNKLYNVTTKDGRFYQGVKQIHDPINQALSYQLPDGTLLGSDAVDTLEEQKNITNEVELIRQDFLSREGREPTREEVSSALAESKGKVAGTVAEKTGAKPLKEAQVKELGARTEKERAETANLQPLSLADIAKFQGMIEARPDQAAKILGTLSKPNQLALIRGGNVDISFLTPDSQKRVRNANITLQHVDTIRQYLKDPDIIRELGAWSGRSEILKSKIGIDTGDPRIANLSPKTQEFISFLTYNRLWEATSTVGYRPSQRVIDVMASSAPRISETPGRIEGALRAEEASTNNVITGELGKLGTGKKTTPPAEDKVTNLKEEK